MSRLLRLLLLLILLPLSALAQDKPEQRRTIAVTGQGEVKAPPDRAVLHFAVETTADKAGAAGEENAKRSTAVTAAVKPLLDPADTVTTAGYSVEPRYDTPRPGEPREPRITGYIARNEVVVETRRVDEVGALIDAATGAGSNRVGGLQFTLAKRTDALRGALEQAGADARAQAESVAKGLGVRLKGVVSATTSEHVPFGPRPFERGMIAMEARAAPTPIEAGELSVTATLQVTYEIE